MSSYVEPVKVDRVMEGAMRGLADGLDPDSAFLSAKQVKAVEAGETLPDGDVGVELTRQYYLRVICRARRLTGAPRPACRPATTSAQSTAPRRATCRCSKAAACCTASQARRSSLTVIRGNAADPHEIDARAREAGWLAGHRPAARLRRRLRPHRLVPAGRHGGPEETGRRPVQIGRHERSSSTSGGRPRGRSRTASRRRACS